MVRKTLVLVILLYTVYIPSAHAYLDPGSGSLIIQVIIGGVAAFFFVLKTYWQKIIGLFSRKGRQGSGDNP